MAQRAVERELAEEDDPVGGRAGQGGLLVWRKADNRTAFTDGNWTWVNGPSGLQKRLNAERFAWETDPNWVSVPTAPQVAAPAPAGLEPGPQTRAPPRTMPGTAPPASPFLVAALGDVATWDRGRQLLRAATDAGVEFFAEPMTEEPGTRVFGSFDPQTRRIRVNTAEMAGASDWVVAGILVHELRHAADFAGGDLARGTERGCYLAALRAFLDQIAWYRFAYPHLSRTTGPMAAHLWGLNARYEMLEWPVVAGDPDLLDYATRAFLAETLGAHQDTCTGRG